VALGIAYAAGFGAAHGVGALTAGVVGLVAALIAGSVAFVVALVLVGGVQDRDRRYLAAVLGALNRRPTAGAGVAG
jgi:hypothetical protein